MWKKSKIVKPIYKEKGKNRYKKIVISVYQYYHET